MFQLQYLAITFWEYIKKKKLGGDETTGNLQWHGN